MLQIYILIKNDISKLRQGRDHTFLKKFVLYIHTHFFTTYMVYDPTSMVGVIQSDLFLSAYNVNNMNTQILICILNKDVICLARRAVTKFIHII